MREALVRFLDLIPSPPRLEIPDIQVIQMPQLATLPPIQVTLTLLLPELLLPRNPLATEILGVVASRVVFMQTLLDNLTIWILTATKNIRLNMTEKLMLGAILASTAPMTQRMGPKDHVLLAATTSIGPIHTHHLLTHPLPDLTAIPEIFQLDRVSQILTQITHPICILLIFLMDQRILDIKGILRVIKRTSLGGLLHLLGLLHLRYIHGAMF